MFVLNISVCSLTLVVFMTAGLILPAASPALERASYGPVGPRLPTFAVRAPFFPAPHNPGVRRPAWSSTQRRTASSVLMDYTNPASAVAGSTSPSVPAPPLLFGRHSFVSDSALSRPSSSRALSSVTHASQFPLTLARTVAGSSDAGCPEGMTSRS
jgi:hypothetical protein